MIDKGKIYKSNHYGNYRIINYVSCSDILIEFISTGYVTRVQSGRIISGKIKDKLFPSVLGVGFVGKGSHNPSFNGKITEAFQSWCNMLKRCYCKVYQEKHPTYIGCSVTRGWHNFQNFAAWFYKYHIEGYHLDKDIKIKGNKIYSPRTCVFVSCSDNVSYALSKNYSFIDPKGDIVKVHNLTKFCNDNNLNTSNMLSVHSGKLMSSKKWTKYEDT